MTLKMEGTIRSLRERRRGYESWSRREDELQKFDSRRVRDYEESLESKELARFGRICSAYEEAQVRDTRTQEACGQAKMSGSTHGDYRSRSHTPENAEVALREKREI